MPGVFGLKKVYNRQRVDNWSESNNYGYFGGGSSPGRVCTIDRIDFSSETVSLPGPSLTEARNVLTGLSGPDYGYFAGGYTPPGYVSTIDRIDFSSETVSLPAGLSLTHNKNGLGAVSSSNYGYFSGGYYSPPNSFFFGTDRIDFSSETVAGPPIHGLNLSQSRNGIAGVFNSDDGYFGGGRTPTSVCTIDRIDFSSETLAVPTAGKQLTQARYYLGSVSSSNYGYFAGGFGGPVVDTIDRIDFSNETTSTPGNDLTEAREAVSGVFSSNYGYFGGGLNADPAYVATIDRIDFSNETFSAPGNNLTQARGYPGAVSGGKSVNSKGIRKGSDKDGEGISSTYGYFVGGFAPPNVCTIDRIDFSTESVAAPPTGQQLPDARDAHAGLSNPNYGYFGGGSSPGDVATIDRIDFSNETFSAPGNNLSTARWGLGAVFSSNYGYFVGGTDYTGKVDRIDFSSETVSQPGNNLGQGNFLLGSLSNSNYGYFAGGRNPLASPQYSATINRIDYNNETVSQPGNNLPEARQSLGGVSDNANYGYFGGGGDPGASATVDRIDFSTTTITPSGNLTQARGGAGAISNSSYGYFGGGTPGPVATVDRIDFSTGTPGPAVGSLSQARYQLAAVSN